jgi:hypothetical protein
MNHPRSPLDTSSTPPSGRDRLLRWLFGPWSLGGGRVQVHGCSPGCLLLSLLVSVLLTVLLNELLRRIF